MEENPIADRELFGQSVVRQDPSHRRAVARAWAIALAAHVAVLLLLIAAHRSGIVQVGGVIPQGIAAFVFPGTPPAGTSGAKPVERRREAVRKTETARETDQEETSDTAAQGTSGQSTDSLIGAGGPVRLVSGVNVHLLKKVVPEYPRVMQAAGVPGGVVLDAIIHRDGTIGDITILKSSGPAFDRAAITAVKQWQYTPLPYEGVVTVTLTFSLNR